MPAPGVSIIMPLYNSAAYVRHAVDSLLGQSYGDFELLVIDDGSTDDGPDRVRAVSDERIRLLTGHPNGGPGAARNRGLAVARGAFVGFLDSDDLAAPGALADLVESMRGSEILSGWHEGIDETGRLNGIDFKTGIPAEKLAPTMLFRNCMPTSMLLIKRECLEGQKFDEDLEPVSDYDMWARLVVSRKARQLPQVVARYRSHPQSISHLRNATAADGLARIFRRQLARLGVEADAEELALHARLCSLTFGTPKATVLAAERWLLKLDAANANAGHYPVRAFREILGERWYGVCHSAGGNGFWTWGQYLGSPLSKWISLTAKERYRLLRLSAGGAFRNLFAASPQP